MVLGENEIVLFAMKPVGLQFDGLHLCGAHLAASRIFAPVEAAGHRQALHRGSSGDQLHDRLVIAQRLSAPVG